MKKTTKDLGLNILLLLCMAILTMGCTRVTRTDGQKAVTENSITPLRVEAADEAASGDTAPIEEESRPIDNEERIDFDIPTPRDGVSEQLLYRKAYIASYNKDTRMPNWVAWRLTADHTDGPYRRPGNAFHEDMDVESPRATNSDYRGSGWSRGHMCPAGDNRWDEKAMYETFLLSNICPQNADLNSGAWNQIEIACRRWAERYGSVYIVCGPILLNREHAVIGEAHVVVPEAFFKVVLCLEGDPKGIGFICRNTDGSHKKDLYVNTIYEVERITGLQFFPHLPDEIARLVKDSEDIEAW